ncbi:MAG: YcnI family copper-binding membrane protein [Sulfitobacter sp.]
MYVKTISSALLFTLLTSTASWSHATLETQSAAVGSTYKGVMRIGHGCDGQATKTVSIKIPEGVISVKPMPKAGWHVETKIGAYAETHDYYGTPLSEGVREIIWTGSLEDAHYDEFVFRGSLVKSLEPGKTIYFPTLQTCADGTAEWVNIPAEGQDPHDMEGPAPGLALTEAGHAHH